MQHREEQGVGALPHRVAAVAAGALIFGVTLSGAAADGSSGDAGCAEIASIYTGPGAATSRCYGAPSLRAAGPGGGFEIDNPEGSGGVVLDIDHACVSCVLIVEGAQTGGARPTLRVSTDGRPPKWIPLREEQSLVDLPPFRQLEIFVYQDAAFRFNLQRIGVLPLLDRYSPKDDSGAARLFLERELGWLPRPAEFRPSLHHAVDVMRTVVPWSDMGLYVGGVETGPIFDRGSFLDMHDYFLRNEGGMICGGHAAYLAAALKELGFDAATFNFGYDGEAYTHVVSMVHFDGRFYLLDPTFNMVFRRGDGGVMTLDELLSTLPDRIVVDEIPDSGRLFFVDRAMVDFGELCEQELFAQGDDVAVCLNDSYDMNYYFMSRGGWGDALAGTGDTALERYIDLLRRGYFNIPHFASAEARETFRALLEENSIPAHPQS